jgi:ATP-dependent helicase/nuclease subunit A
VAESALKWTPEQRAGIETVGVNLLVSAAAGSGKTAVLAQRCAHLVCDARPPCDVDQLLVVTFTEAAAAEMKGRIELALRKRLEGAPEDARLRRQLAQIDRAQVGTLHGFCARLLRQHFHLVGLDPNFTILDGDEAKLLRAQVVRDLFADRYEGEGAGDFQKFIDVYGDGSDEALAVHAVRTHELLCGVIDPAQWLAEAQQRIEEGAAAPRLAETAIGRELAEIIRRRLGALAERCAEAIDLVASLGGFGKYVECLQGLAGEIDAWTAAFGKGRFDALAQRARDFKSPRKPTVKNDTAGKAAAEAAFDSVREAMGDKGGLYPLIRFSEPEWKEGLASVRPFAAVFVGLVREFGERYEAAKQRARRVDFADLERLALRLLRATDGGPSGVARSLHRQIAHVLVDEYQDINGVQDAILSLVSRGTGYQPVSSLNQGHGPVAHATEGTSPNLFCVGDVKQSIYGFRLAEPGRFLERYARMKAGGEGQVIDLQSNFRSRGPLLEAINGLFARLMTAEAADIEYDESQKLRAAATFPADSDGAPAFAGAPVELHLLPRDVGGEGDPDDDATEAGAPELDRTEREASFIAARVHTLLGHDGSPRMHVADRSADGDTILRPIDYRDVVILLRSMVYKSDQIAEVLRRHGIPVHRESGSGYFDTTEVRDVLSLLRVLDNFQQDVPLAAVLRSPLAAFEQPEDALARIRLPYRSAASPIPFHEAVTRYAAEQTDELAERLRTFLAQLERWRQAARMRPLAELLWQVLDDTGYLTFCSGLENGEQRVANVMYLYERARQFAAFSRQGLYRFLQFLEALAAESDLGLPPVLGPGENVVRIMSVHKSKGLEFPVVFLPDLGKRLNLSAASGRLLVDRVRCLGLVAVDEGRQVRYPSLASVLVAERLRQQALAEELRVLYVAVTRAKEHLILVGTCDARTPERWRTLWGAHPGPLPAETILSASTMLEWIGPAIAGPGSAFELTMHTAEDVHDVAVEAEGAAKLTPQQAALAALKPLTPEPPPSAVADEVIRRLTYQYPHAAFSNLRAAVAVTELGREHVAVGELPLPKSIGGDLGLTAADRGAATHLVLQHLDFSQPCRGEDLAAQVEWIVHRRLLTAEQAAAVDLPVIEWFFSTDLGRRVRHAAPDDVLREVPFAMPMTPQRIGVNATPGGPADRVMVRGRIDLLVREGESYLVVDYKTDRVAAEEVESRREDYQTQMAIYGEAIRSICGAPECEVKLVFLTPRVIY